MGNRFAVLDTPQDKVDTTSLANFRGIYDSSYAAMYAPWIKVFDPLCNQAVFQPPSGAVCGIYARSDTQRGVHKAPANEVVRGCTGLSVSYNTAEQAKLNPIGINLIRAIPGQGIRVWGARTCSSDGNWKYVNVRRLFLFLEESIRANTNWVVFEPNDESLWARVKGTITLFLETQRRNGALAGSTPDQAYYVNVGATTMTQDDILNGRLICEIGVAPVRPAEFVVFRITQITQSTT
ncbi:phage tail sheath subtilisin-like domain-containing protein [Flavonifractor sp. An82]|uniref:phage tail sheath family protein n=1 Tax=Flavonifractor sp. An82 TaxID=1965660 RepID=UPI00267BC31C